MDYLTRFMDYLTIIIMSTPLYAWFILLVLIILGVSLSRDRQLSPLRVALLPIATTIFSLYGLLADFGPSFYTIAAWGLGIVVTSVIGLYVGLPAGVKYDEQSNRFSIEGSWIPLIILMVIFGNKYIINVIKIFSIPIIEELWFRVSICGLYGFYNGIFCARALVIMRHKYKQKISNYIT